LGEVEGEEYQDKECLSLRQQVEVK
jgi:hypothetical protein